MTTIDILIRGEKGSPLLVQGGGFTEGIDVLQKNSVHIDGRNVTIEIYVDDRLVKRIDLDENGEEG